MSQETQPVSPTLQMGEESLQGNRGKWGKHEQGSIEKRSLIQGKDRMTCKYAIYETEDQDSRKIWRTAII